MQQLAHSTPEQQVDLLRDLLDISLGQPQAVVAASNAIALLVQLLSGSEHLQSAALQVLCNVTRLHRTRTQVLRAGLVSATVPLLASPSLDVKQHAVGLLSNLASERPAAKAMVAVGAVAPLLHLLSCREPLVLRRSTVTIAQLAQYSFGRKELTAAGAVPRLVALLSAAHEERSGGVVCSEQAAIALRYLAAEDPDLCDELISGGAVDRLAHMLQSSEPQLQADAVELVALLASHTDSQSVLAAAGGPSSIIALMDSPSLQVQLSALRAVHIVLPGQPLGMMEAGLPAGLVSLLQASDPEVRRGAALLSYQLAANMGKPACRALRAAGAVDALVACIEMFAAEEEQYRAEEAAGAAQAEATPAPAPAAAPAAPAEAAAASPASPAAPAEAAAVSPAAAGMRRAEQEAAVGPDTPPASGECAARRQEQEAAAAGAAGGKAAPPGTEASKSPSAAAPAHAAGADTAPSDCGASQSPAPAPTTPEPPTPPAAMTPSRIQPPTSEPSTPTHNTPRMHHMPHAPSTPAHSTFSHAAGHAAGHAAAPSEDLESLGTAGAAALLACLCLTNLSAQLMTQSQGIEKEVADSGAIPQLAALLATGVEAVQWAAVSCMANLSNEPLCVPHLYAANVMLAVDELATCSPAAAQHPELRERADALVANMLQNQNQGAAGSGAFPQRWVQIMDAVRAGDLGGADVAVTDSELQALILLARQAKRRRDEKQRRLSSRITVGQTAVMAAVAVEAGDACTQCGVPRRTGRKMLRCAGCHSAWYCSPMCMQSHWPQHKQACIQSFAKWLATRV